MIIHHYCKSYKISDDSLVNVDFIDTEGKVRYKSILYSYYHKADSIILVYDITNRKSFDEYKNFFIHYIREKYKNETNNFIKEIKQI